MPRGSKPNRPSSPAPRIPPRAPCGPLPKTVLEPRPGRFLWTCREGFEPQLFEELAWERCGPRLLGPTLVEGESKSGIRPAFGRAGFEVLGLWKAPFNEEDAHALSASIQAQTGSARVSVQAWAPDSAVYQGLSPLTQRLGTQLQKIPGPAWSEEERPDWLAQLCIASKSLAVVGLVRARDAVSLSAGGRLRMRRTREAPSRAAMKLDEALETLGYGPERGDRCADLGAAPGGWTLRLVERGAHVTAVDPGPLRAGLATHPKVRHLRESAFRYEPEEPMDWLFCDMAWRPLEVAQLLAKWARQGWADALCANIKLPMKDKNPMLFRIRALLEEAGWRRLRIRQLYHDRDEVTVTAGRR